LFKLIDSDSTEIVLHSEDKQTWLELLNSTIKKMSMTPQEIKSLKDEDERTYVGGTAATGLDASDLSRENLVELIISWSTLKADDALAAVQQIASRLQNDRKSQ
jgi:hypothetical protein